MRLFSFYLIDRAVSIRDVFSDLAPAETVALLPERIRSTDCKSPLLSLSADC